VARLSLADARFARLFVNGLRFNILDHPNWQLGPVGLWRFGRRGMDNHVLDKVHDIDSSLSLVLTGSYVRRDKGLWRCCT